MVEKRVHFLQKFGKAAENWLGLMKHPLAKHILGELTDIELMLQAQFLQPVSRQAKSGKAS